MPEPTADNQIEPDVEPAVVEGSLASPAGGEEELATDDAGEQEQIVDWAVEPEQPAEGKPWQAGAILQYLTPGRRRIRRTEGWSVHPIVGRLALCAGAAALIPLFWAMQGAASDEPRPLFFIVGAIFVFGAYVLGTIGRRSSPTGRRDAVIGRRVAIAIPLLLIIVGGFLSARESQAIANTLAVLALLAAYSAVVFMITLMIDGILGTD